MELLFNVGDKVIVRKDIQEDSCYHMVSCAERSGYRGMYVNSEMADKAGRIVTISDVVKDINCGYHYRIEEDVWCWTDEMFERKRNSILFNQLL